MRRWAVLAAAVALAAVAAAHGQDEEADPRAEEMGALDKLHGEMRDSDKEDIRMASARALKFQQAGLKSAVEARKASSKAMEAAAAAAAARAGADAELFKVTPAAKEGVEVKPAPGQNDPPVRIRAQDDFLGDVTPTTDYIGSHSYKEDIKALLDEVDKSENMLKGLKLRIVEKENFLDSLVKREDLLQEDVTKDKTSLENLVAHVRALKFRVQRVKKEKQLRLLEAQFHEYSAAASKLKAQASELASVKEALYSKMKNLHSDILPLRQKEDASMRTSIDADGAKTRAEDKVAEKAVEDAAAAQPAVPDAAAEQPAAAAAEAASAAAPAAAEGAAAAGAAAAAEGAGSAAGAGSAEAAAEAPAEASAEGAGSAAAEGAGSAAEA